MRDGDDVGTAGSDTGLRIRGYALHVMTAAAGRRHAQALSDLAAEVGYPAPPAVFAEPTGSDGRVMYGKHVHSVYLAAADGRPVALVAGEEDPTTFGDPALFVAVLAVDPALQGGGLGRTFVQAAIRRSLELGWTELVTDAPFRLATVVTPAGDTARLTRYYTSLGFEPQGQVRLRGADVDLPCLVATPASMVAATLRTVSADS